MPSKSNKAWWAPLYEQEHANETSKAENALPLNLRNRSINKRRKADKARETAKRTRKRNRR